MAKKRMPLYGIIGIFRDFFGSITYLFFNETKFIRLVLSIYNLHIIFLFQLNISLNVDFMAKKCTKSAIPQFAIFTQF